MKEEFNSKQEALEYKAKHELLGRVAEPIIGTDKWALNFPVLAHVTVNQPHSIGIEDPVLHGALDRIAFSGRIVLDQNG